MCKRALLLFFIFLAWVLAMGNQPSIDKNALDNLPLFSNTTNKLYITNEHDLARQLLASKEMQKELWKFCGNRNFPVDTLYFEFGGLSGQAEQISALVEQAQKNNIKVFVYLPKEEPVKNFIERATEEVISYNLTYSSARLTGLCFNFEPYLKNPDAVSGNQLAARITGLKNSRFLAARSKADLQLGVLLPYYFVDAQDTQNKYVHQLFNFVNFINVSVNSNDPDETIAKILPLARYEEEISTEINLNISLDPEKPDISYADQSLRNFKKQTEQIENSLRKFKKYRGLALNNYWQLRNLLAGQSALEMPAVNATRLYRDRDVVFKLSTANVDLVVLSLREDRENLYFKIQVQPGSGTTLTAAQYLELRLSGAQNGSAKRKTLAFKVELPPPPGQFALTPVVPAQAGFVQDWPLSGERQERSIKLNFSIPKKDIFLDSFNNNYIKFNFSYFYPGLKDPFIYSTDPEQVLLKI